MKIFFIISILIAVAIVAILLVSAQSSKSGSAVGLVDGVLADCPSKPNCFCSENKNDSEHYVEPINYGDLEFEAVVETLKSIVVECGGEVQKHDNAYLGSTFSSPLLGFVDDVEFRIDRTEKKVHIRSASRVGHSDLGANKKRISTIKKLFQQKSLKN